MSDKQQETSFDFYGKKNDDLRRELDAQHKAQKESFFKIGKNALIAAGFLTVVAGTSVFGYNAYQSYIDDQIVKVEKSISSSNTNTILEHLKAEKTLAQQTFAKNQILINDFARYKDLIQVIGFGNQLALLNTQNAKVFKEVTTSFNADQESIERFLKATSGTRDEKIKEFLNDAKGSDLSRFNVWQNNLKDNKPVYVNGLIDINQEIVKQHVFLAQTQKDIIDNVQQRLKNKDYDINAAQASFANQIKKDTEEDLSDLKQAKLELKDTEDALREDAKEQLDSDDTDYTSARNLEKVSKILTDDDVNQAESALNTVQQEALSQLAQDKAKVDQLIAQANANNGNLSAPPVANSTLANNVANNGMAPQSSPQVVHVHSGPSFADYYLMYAFMNSGSSGTVNNNYYNNSTPSSSFGNSNNYKPVPALAKSNPYSLKNSDSLLNRSLSDNTKVTTAKNAVNKTTVSSNIAALRTKIATAKTRAAQVRTTRAAELKRMGYANSYEAGKTGVSSRGAKSSIASSRGTKSSVSSARSSVSRGGFGGGHASVGG